MSAAGPATADAQIDTSRSSRILWFEANVDVSEPSFLQINIMAPKGRDGGRMLWQRCRFAYVDDGTYMCGIDVSRGSLASKHPGMWAGRVKIGGVFSGRTFVRL